MLQTRNPFLSAVGARLRYGRAPYPREVSVTINTEAVDGKPFIRVWFRTAGCTYDRQGLCTMCNYGISDGVPETVVDDIRAALRGIPIDATSTVLVSPSGSMFDPREVPDNIRAAILEAVAETAAGTVVCETRPETVTDEHMREFAAAIGTKAGVIELGLESADSWILQWCVNKRLDLGEFRRAVKVCHAHDLRVLANVSLGTAFLPEGAAVRDAELTVRWAMDCGVDGCVLFPLHVREWTVLGWLWRRGWYKPPSLWSLVEVLRRLAVDYPGVVTAAWYRDYNAGLQQAAIGMPILASPTTCPNCADMVIRSLDQYRDSADPVDLDAAVLTSCSCRSEWLATTAGTEVDLERVQHAYAELGASALGSEWWDVHGGQVIQELVAARSGSRAAPLALRPAGT